MPSRWKCGGALATGAALWLVASCSQVLDLDDDYFVGPGSSTSGTGGTGGTGTDCPEGEQDNDENGTCEPACLPDACSDHGTCDDSSGTATCSCDGHFGGDDCASCDEGYAGPDCTDCAAGFQDQDDNGTCSPECGDSTCSGNGTCDDSSGTATCTCRPDYGGDDCGTACPSGMAGPSCEFRIIYGLDIPAAVADWDVVGDVPYDIDDAANAAEFDRVAFRLILDDEEVWVEMAPFTSDAAELGMPMEVVHDVPVTDVTVASFSSNQPTISAPTDGNVEMWSNCYSAGPNGVYDYDDDISSGTD
ncbi:MAG: hypothetical protein JRI68_24345, partial [Deltaproteobacteria bacterium]|nr:hypothetical protein [Deltaproteobacteria bacterium]